MIQEAIQEIQEIENEKKLFDVESRNNSGFSCIMYENESPHFLRILFNENSGPPQ